MFVVDTNVPIVANGRKTDADQQCRLACIMKLRGLVKQEVIAVDDRDLILQEYRGHLRASGQPGVGDVFFKHLLDSQYLEDRVRRVSVTPCNDDQKGFEELPENTFDRSDRKFLAVAVKAGAVVVNATDGDWCEHRTLMERLGVEVDQLCPEYFQARRGGGR